MQKKTVLMVALVLLLAAAAMVALAACGEEGDTGARDDGSATPAAEATGEPLIIGFDGGFTGFMAMDVALAEQGILTAIDMVGGQWNGRPIEYVKADNASDPVQAVDKARQLVESDGIQFMAGPIFSPSAAAVTDYLAKAGGIPQSSIVGQPSDNLKTANGLAFFPNGLYGSQGYYFGKYCAETLGYKTANCLNYEDTAARQLQAGFDKGFKEGGGQILSTQYVPIDAVDFSAYLTKMKPADCTYFWVFGNGAAPFVKQYNDYGLESPLVMAMANNFSEPQLRDLGDLGLDMVAGDFYTPEIDNEMNKAFVEAYKAKYEGEYPPPQAYGGYQAVQLFLAGVEATGGDTTPSKLIEAMSTISLDMPTGKMTMQPYQDGFIPTKDWFIMKTQQVGDRIAWVPVYTYEQVTLGE